MNAIDAYRINKAQARRAFGRAAVSYDRVAVLQREVLARMLARLELVALQPAGILDAGCGTGGGCIALSRRYPGSRVIGLDFAEPMLRRAQARPPWWQRWGIRRRHDFVCADMEALPLRDQSVNLVWSNLAMQWCNDLDGLFGEMERILQPEGLLMFSTFGPDTLKELRHSSADGHTHVSRFVDMHDIGDALVRAGFSAPVMDVEYFTLTYNSPLEVMRDLQAIGATNATAGRPSGLAGKAFLQRLTQRYEQFRGADGKLPATYEVVYGHAWKPQTPPAQGSAQPIRFHRR